MRAPHPSHDLSHATLTRLGVSAALLAGFFALLVAAAHPGLAAVVLGASAIAVGLQRVDLGSFRRQSPRVPGGQPDCPTCPS